MSSFSIKHLLSGRQWQRFLLLTAFITAAVPVMASDFFTDFPQHRYRIVAAQVYTPSGWPQALKGDLYLPRSPSASVPVVLVVHGGSWQAGARDDYDIAKVAKALAVHGYAAFSIDYRLAPQNRHPAQLQDMQQSLRWLQAHAGDYRLDMHRLSAWGYSAGAHLVSLLAVQPDMPGLPPLRAVVAGGTPADLRVYPDSPAAKALLGSRPAESPELYKEASPLALVRPGLPPFFLYHGAVDDLVLPSQAENFASALRADGVPVELLLLPDYGHVKTALFQGRSAPAALNFLDRQTSSQTP
ncbi:MAG: alpha/beta hydrolase [bacterium]|nr:alpha/beta hydrolase [bacterium]